MNEMSVNVKKGRPFGKFLHDMPLPDLFKQCFTHVLQYIGFNHQLARQDSGDMDVVSGMIEKMTS